MKSLPLIFCSILYFPLSSLADTTAQLLSLNKFFTTPEQRRLLDKQRSPEQTRAFTSPPRSEPEAISYQGLFFRHNQAPVFFVNGTAHAADAHYKLQTANQSTAGDHRLILIRKQGHISLKPGQTWCQNPASKSPRCNQVDISISVNHKHSSQ